MSFRRTVLCPSNLVDHGDVGRLDQRSGRVEAWIGLALRLDGPMGYQGRFPQEPTPVSLMADMGGDILRFVRQQLVRRHLGSSKYKFSEFAFGGVEPDVRSVVEEACAQQGSWNGTECPSFRIFRNCPLPDGTTGADCGRRGRENHREGKS